MTDPSIAALRKARLANWIAAMSLRAEAADLMKRVEDGNTPVHEAAVLRATSRVLDRAGGECIRAVQELNDFFDADDNVHSDYDKWLSDGRPLLAP